MRDAPEARAISAVGRSSSHSWEEHYEKVSGARSGSRRRCFHSSGRACRRLGSAALRAATEELVAKHGVHQTVINNWKRQALEGMAGIFSGKAEVYAAEKDGENEKLHRGSGNSWLSAIF